MTEELKPCAHCGSAAAYWSGVMCAKCGVRVSYVNGTVDQHYSAWNRRAIFPEVRALVMAATRLIAQRADLVGKKYGGPVGIEMDDGEKGYIVHSDDCDALAAALVPFKEVE